MSSLKITRSLFGQVAKDGPANINDYNFGKAFRSKDEGSVILTESGSRIFNESIVEIIENFGKDETISRQGIDEKLREAIFYVLDINKKRQSIPIDARINNAIKNIRKYYNSDPEVYTVYIQIAGWDPNDLPKYFGNLRFTRFGAYHLAQLCNDIDHHIVSNEEIKFRKKYVKNDLKKSELWNDTCAIMNQKAKDYNAALSLAREEVRLTLDCIGLYQYFIPFCYLRPYILGDLVSTQTISLLRHPDKGFSIPRRSVNKGCFSLKNFSDTHRDIQQSYNFLSACLKNKSVDKNHISNIVIASAQWIGLAGRTNNRAISFLNYMIGLESILLPVEKLGATGYRMRTRIAHHFGGTYDNRKHNREMFRRLYSVRNRIVHEGRYFISTSDLNSAKHYASYAFIFLSNLIRRKKITTKVELENWYENQVIK